MPHPNGTPTAEDHATEARALLEPLDYEGDHFDFSTGATVNALRAIGHALLALHEDNEHRRAYGPGY